MKHVFISGFKPGNPVATQLAVISKEMRLSSTNQKYIHLNLGDSSGKIIGRVFVNQQSKAEDRFRGIHEGQVYLVDAAIQEFPPKSGNISLKVNRMEPQNPTEYEIKDFTVVSPRDPEEMMVNLEELILNMKDKEYQETLNKVLGTSDIYDEFYQAPAAIMHHHNYLHGLLEHTHNVVFLALKYTELYVDDVDKDLLITAAIMHDLGKIGVYEYSLVGDIKFSEEGKLINHIYKSMQLVEQYGSHLPDDKKQKLLHCLGSHHGPVSNGWGSSTDPKSPEAALLFTADYMDAMTTKAVADQALKTK